MPNVGKIFVASFTRVDIIRFLWVKNSNIHDDYLMLFLYIIRIWFFFHLWYNVRQIFAPASHRSNINKIWPSTTKNWHKTDAPTTIELKHDCCLRFYRAVLRAIRWAVAVDLHGGNFHLALLLSSPHRYRFRFESLLTFFWRIKIIAEKKLEVTQFFFCWVQQIGFMISRAIDRELYRFDWFFYFNFLHMFLSHFYA